jgi:hypothetical protein
MNRVAKFSSVSFDSTFKWWIDQTIKYVCQASVKGIFRHSYAHEH